MLSPINKPRPERLLRDLCSALSPRIEQEAGDGSAAGFIPGTALAASPRSLLPSGRRRQRTPKPHHSSPELCKGAGQLGCQSRGTVSACCSMVEPPEMQSLLPKTRRSPVPGLLASRGDLFLHHARAGGQRRGRVNSGVAMETGEDGWMDGGGSLHTCHGRAESSHLLPTQPACVTLRLLITC